MKLNKSSIILLAVVLIQIILMIMSAYGDGCPPNGPGKPFCWGQGQINILGLKFSRYIESTLFKPLITSIILTAIVTAGAYYIYHYLKKYDSKKLLNIAVKTFCIMFLILSIYGYVWTSSIVY